MLGAAFGRRILGAPNTHSYPSIMAYDVVGGWVVYLGGPPAVTARRPLCRYRPGFRAANRLPVIIRKQYHNRMTRTIDLPDELAAALKDVAAAEHRSVQQTLVLAAQEYVERHRLRARVRASGLRVTEQDRELLDRLAQ
jgi:hypothetical protein